MKTFLNVLYRRILYKIPLKLLLILLVLFGLLFLGFSKADNVATLITSYNIPSSTITTSWSSVIDLGSDSVEYTICMQFDGWINVQYSNIYVGFTNNYNGQPGTYITYYNGWRGNYVCLYKSVNDRYINIRHANTETTVEGDYFILDNLLATTIPVYTSIQCQTEYNLIPINSVDSQYCQNNNLCPSQDIPVGTGNLTQLYINNILHVGAPTILMNIPEEIDWDYAYTMGGNIMNIDIVGYNVDYDKINDQITIQNYKPSSDDLSQVVSGIIPLFVPGLCIILLLYFIFRFIKKIF